MAEILAEVVSELRSDYPDIPLAPGIDLERIKAGDPNPFFVTLPLVKVGGKSNNGFTWGAPDVQRVVEEINAKRPGGNLGHIKPDDRSHEYGLPRLQWVGAKLVNGQSYGKAYVPKYAGDVREFFELAAATGARVGTSVYGTRGEKGLSDMTLESIDLGHPDRLGSPDAAAVPKITSEMEGDENVGENDTLIAELRKDKQTALDTVTELQGTVRTKQQEIDALQGSKTTLDAVVSELKLGDKPLETAKALVSELTTLRGEVLKTKIEAVIVAEVKNEALRPYIHKLMMGIASEDDAKKRVTELLADKEIQDLSKKLVVETRGGSAYVGRSDGGGESELKDTPENRERARSRFGV